MRNKNQQYTLCGLFLLSLTTSACAVEKVTPPNQSRDTVNVPISKSAKFVVAVDEVGNIVTMTGINSKGEPEKAVECALCTRELAHKFEGHCDKLISDEKLRQQVLTEYLGKEKQNLPICAATTRATISDTKQIQLMFMHKNPDCIVKIQEGGRTVFAYPPKCAH